MLTTLLALGLLLPPTVAARVDPRDLLFETLTEELERSRTSLKLAEHAAPYYIGYRLVERTQVSIEARFGAVYIDEQETQRQAAVDVRVGDYTFDSAPDPEDASTLFDDLEGFRPVREAPVDDHPAALRATLWLLTDQAYKKALSTFLKKQARRVSTVEDKHVDSFSREAKSHHVDPPTLLVADAEAWRGVARRLSARFREAKHLLDGTVRFSGERVRTWLVTSEGTRVLKEHLMYSVAFDAVSQAPDGMLLEQGETFYASAPEALPNEAALNAMVTKSLENLVALASAPLADPYTGPAILEPEATGVFFHETIGHRLEGERQNDENEGRTFKGSVGQEIIPPFLSVRDDPSLAAWQGTPLNGHYLYDDQGVPARNVVLVENGVLKTFLTSRTPIEDVNKSNGHGRAQGIHTPMARMGNLIVESTRRVPRAELKAQLLAAVRAQKKPYGLIIRDITGGSTNTSNYGYQAFKGTPRMVYKVDATTGAETLVRGVEMVGTPLTVISKIIATSEEMGIFNGYCGAESGYVPVSAIAPATLFSEIELQRSQRDKERPPLLPPPWATP
jgi:TldD protein